MKKMKKKMDTSASGKKGRGGWESRVKRVFRAFMGGGGGGDDDF